MNDSNSLELENGWVERLRELASQGRSATELVKSLQSWLGLEGESRFLIVRYFVRAFGMSLRDARTIEGAHCLGNDAISDDELNAKLQSLIATGIKSAHRPNGDCEKK